MRIALIQTPVEDFYYTPQRSYPLGLTYLAAAVTDLPVTTEIVDLVTGFGRHMIKIPDNFKPVLDLLPYDRSPISAFHAYYHFGASWSRIETYFSENSYDLYAISSNFYTYSNEVLITAGIIKRTNPGAIVVVGGQNVGPEHPLFTDSPHIDHCIRGEADHSFKHYVNALITGSDLSGIPGIYRKEVKSWNEPETIRNFNSCPASDILPSDRYKIAGYPAVMIAGSRGCPMGCRFCSIARSFGQELRLKPANIFLQEMHTSYRKGIRAFDIEDDNFTFNRDHCIDLLTKIRNNFGGKIKLYAMNGLSAEHLDEEIIDLLYGSGMRLLNLSIATSSEEQLKRLHRKTSIDHFSRISQYASSKGMKVMGHFIAGLPKQSIEEVLETMRTLSGLPLVLGISPFYYIPGMNMTVPHTSSDCRDARLSRFWPAHDTMDELDLITLFRLSRWINYLKDKLKHGHISHLNFKEIANAFRDDAYITGLIRDHLILGMDNRDTLFPHRTSTKILDSFFGLFDNCDVYCG